MNEIGGAILQFHCRLTSSFHTTRQEYASLWKCAPFIPGSTLRGAALSHLIQVHCTPERIATLEGLEEPEEIAAFHCRCEEDCPVRSFFAEPSPVCFSFGQFEGKWRFQEQTRIALAREAGSVAEGAIVSVETVEAGTPFTFEVCLLGSGPTPEVIEAGVRGAAGVGIGGLRSIGLGQFAVKKVTSRPLGDHVADLRVHLPLHLDEGPLRLTFTTPYVLADGQSSWDGDPEALAQRLEAELEGAAQAAGVEVSLPGIGWVDAALHPDFIGRWSYERGCRENRLVAWPGSTLTLHLSEPGDLETALALAQAFGLGDWATWGFGRFEVAAKGG